MKKRKKTLKNRAFDWFYNYGYIGILRGRDVMSAWLAGYRAGRRDARKGKRK